MTLLLLPVGCSPSGADISSNIGYGYYWWLADLSTNEEDYFSASARGGGGQNIILIEDLDLVIVITAHDNGTDYMQFTAERILPAFLQ